MYEQFLEGYLAPHEYISVYIILMTIICTLFCLALALMILSETRHPVGKTLVLHPGRMYLAGLQGFRNGFITEMKHKWGIGLWPQKMGLTRTRGGGRQLLHFFPRSNVHSSRGASIFFSHPSQHRGLGIQMQVVHTWWPPTEATEPTGLFSDCRQDPPAGN